MNQPQKKGPSYVLVFLLGFLTPIAYSACRSLVNHWPEIKSAIAKWWG